MRILSLDVLRGSAMVLVILSHTSLRNVVPLPEPFPTLDRFGWVGMEIFFALSGFLMSQILFGEIQATGRLRLGRFLLRRGLKIYPNYFFVIAVSVAYLAYARQLETSRVWHSVFFLANYLPGVWMHFWSLSLEEHFYLGFSIALVVTLRRGRAPVRALLAATIAIVLFGLASRLYVASFAKVNHFNVLWPTQHRLSGLLGGAVLGYWYTVHPAALARFYRRYQPYCRWGPVALLAPFFFVEWYSFFAGTFGIEMAAVAGVLLVLTLVMENHRIPSQSPWLSWLGFMGRYSYGIYLAHFPIRKLIPEVAVRWTGAPLAPFTEFFLYLILGISAGVLLTYVVERPFLRLRERWPRGRPASWRSKSSLRSWAPEAGARRSPISRPIKIRKRSSGAGMRPRSRRSTSSTKTRNTSKASG